MNNISVSNSVVGTINTGNIGSVDQSISALLQAGEKDTAEVVKQLSEAVLGSSDLSRNQQNEIVEILSVVAKEAAAPVAARKSAVAHSLIDRASKVTALANDIADLCKKLWPLLLSMFPSNGG